jgi:hypothetical protein
MNHQDRYLISVSYNEVSKCDMFHVWDNNGGVIRSAHRTQREAKAAMKRYVADDERKAGDAQ